MRSGLFLFGRLSGGVSSKNRDPCSLAEYTGPRLTVVVVPVRCRMTRGFPPLATATFCFHTPFQCVHLIRRTFFWCLDLFASLFFLHQFLSASSYWSSNFSGSKGPDLLSTICEEAPTCPLVFFHRGFRRNIPLLCALHTGMATSAQRLGQNVRIEYRWGRGQFDILKAFAFEETCGRSVMSDE
jgi:hypothetical protein